MGAKLGELRALVAPGAHPGARASPGAARRPRAARWGRRRGAGEVRHRRAAVRRLRGAARGRLRRAPGGERDRREDRRDAAAAVRRTSRGCARPPPTRTRTSPPAPAARSSRRATTRRSPPHVTRVARDIDLGKPDLTLPLTPRDPDRLVELSNTWNLESPIARLVESSPASADPSPGRPAGSSRASAGSRRAQARVNREGRVDQNSSLFPGPRVNPGEAGSTGSEGQARGRQLLRLGGAAGRRGGALGLGEHDVGVAGVPAPPLLAALGQRVDRVVVLVGPGQRLGVGAPRSRCGSSSSSRRCRARRSYYASWCTQRLPTNGTSHTIRGVAKPGR